MKKTAYPDPKFKSIEEEEKFWETHDPLTEGYEMKLEPASKKRKRVSFLSVRLTAEEIGLLHDLSAKHGVGISTFTRRLILNAVAEDKAAARHVTANEIAAALKRVGIVKVTEKAPVEKKRKVAAAR